MSAGPRRRVAILISGRGSNMASLIAAARDPDYPAEIALVVSNRPEAQGLSRAVEAGIATAVVDHAISGGRAAFERELAAVLQRSRIDLVCLAGFMRIFTDGFAETWAGRMINIHPSLLPAFKGRHPNRQAIEAGCRIHGCTVHYVVPELDSGPIVAQAAVAVRPDDDEETLSAHVLAQEHLLYPLALGLVASGRAKLVGAKVEIAPGIGTALGLASTTA